MMMSVFRKYPVTKSMAAYSLLYPGANCVQQKYVRKSDEIDWTEVGRFLVYGSLVHAPLVYNAMNFISRTFPGTSLPQLLKKVR